MTRSLDDQNPDLKMVYVDDLTQRLYLLMVCIQRPDPEDDLNSLIIHVSVYDLNQSETWM